MVSVKLKSSPLPSFTSNIFVSVLSLVIYRIESLQVKCPPGKQLCGGDCISAKDFCTIGFGGSECFPSKTCPDHTCVDPYRKCDPPSCPPGWKRCHDKGSCTRNGQSCCSFYKKECPDGSCISLTEFFSKHCSCPVLSNYHCPNKKCIERRQACNGVNDCGDNSDERNCPTYATDFDHPETGIFEDSEIAIIVGSVGVLLFVVFVITCLVLCCRRPSRREYWRRRERTFAETTPVARTAQTLVRQTSRNQVPVPSYIEQGDLETVSMQPPPYDSTLHAPLDEDDDEPPPAYEDVIKDEEIIVDTSEQNNINNCESDK